MIININEVLLRQRWLAIALIALTVVIIKIVERRPDRLSDLDPYFLGNILIFGVAFPLAIGILLDVLVRTNSKLAHMTNALNNNSRDKVGQRVLIVENGLLLGAGIKNLLSREADLDLVGLTPSNEAELIKNIKLFKPEVVILDEATYLTNAIRLLALLKNYPELRLVVVNTNNNLMYVYDKQKRLVSQATDLVNVIRRC